MFATLLFWFFVSACVKALSIEEQIQDANGNITTLKDTRILGWTNGPTFRGTGSILWSCLVTILAAVYTAIHLDIPVKHQTAWERFVGRVKWALIALLAPEMMLRLAMKQYLSARKLLKQINSDDDAPVNTTPRKKYSMVYAFYIVMGGVVVDTSRISDVHPLLALTAKGAGIVAKAGHVLDIDLDQVADRSKLGAVGKILVCFQVSWMFVQCVARGVAGYPLTLLEVHTMAYVVCTILIYFFWWHKPNDIGEAQLWDAKGYEDVIALLMMTEVTFFVRSDGDFMAELQELQFTEHPSYPTSDSLSDQNETILVSCGEYLPCGLGPKDTTRRLGVKGLERWGLTTKALLRLEPDMMRHLGGPNMQAISESYENGLAAPPHAGSTSGSEWHFWSPQSILYMMVGTMDRDVANMFWVAIFLLPLIYGGAHLTAWNFEFPSQIEGYLWKACGLGIMLLAPAIVVLAIVIVLLHGVIDGIVKTCTGYDIEWYGYFIIFPMAALAITTFCRLYLVVESFISLRDLPLGAFVTTPWLQAIPHI